VDDVNSMGCACDWRRHTGAPISSAAIPDLVDVSSRIARSLCSVLGNLIELNVRELENLQGTSLSSLLAESSKMLICPFSGSACSLEL
jgi:hypothetical protein